MKQIKEKLSPKNIEKELKDLLKEHRNKQKLFCGQDFARYTRLVRLEETKRKYMRTENIFTYLVLTVICIAIIFMAYGSLWIINYLMML